MEQLTDNCFHCFNPSTQSTVNMVYYLGWSRLASWYNFSNTWPPLDITTPGSIFSYSK